MKIKLFIPIVIVMMLFASTITVAARPSNLPLKEYRKVIREKVKEILFNVFSDIAERLYEKNGWVPERINNILSALGR